MFGAHEYIKQQFAKPWYSEVLHERSAVVGAVNQAQVDYGQWGATMILISGITFTSDGGGAAFNFTDQFGRVIIALNAAAAATGHYEIYHVIKGSTLLVNYGLAAATAIFTVQHQYLREVDLKK